MPVISSLLNSIVILAICGVLPLTSYAKPSCLKLNDSADRADVFRTAHIEDLELLQRLVFAEGISTNVSANEECRTVYPEILTLIAYGVMNRVRLSKASSKWERKYGKGVYGVIFKRGQFNPAISKHSQFAQYFSCPTQYENYTQMWALAAKAAESAVNHPENNPLVLTEWEKKNHLSLVSHFYYPLSLQATANPPAWAKTPSPSWVQPLRVNAKTIAPSCIWFFRHEKPRKLNTVKN